MLAYWFPEPSQTLPLLQRQGLGMAPAPPRHSQHEHSLKHCLHLQSWSQPLISRDSPPSLVYCLMFLKHISVQCFCYSKYLTIVSDSITCLTK